MEDKPSGAPIATQAPLEVFLDESGYTGDDLLNADQPVFVLASTILSDEEAATLLAEHFPQSTGHELKHSSIGSRPRGQRRMAEFIRLLSERGVCATEVWHKEFTLVTTMVDCWVEESTRLHGIDLYDRGGNIGLANLLYMTFVNLLPRHLFRAHLARYQQMMRERTPAAYQRFWGELRRLFDIADTVLRDALIYLLGSERDLGFAHIELWPGRPLNVLPSSLLTLAKHWREHAAGREMLFVHDESRDLARDKWMWDLLLSPTVPEATVGYDRRQISFPLGVSAVRFERSDDHPALQVADLVAGAMAVVARNGIDGTYRPGYADSLRRAGVEEFGVRGNVWPSLSVTPEDMGTIGPNSGGDPADYIASLLPSIERLRKMHPATFRARRVIEDDVG